MKLKSALCALIFAGFAYADMVVGPNALPQNAQNFIQTYFKGVQIGLVKQDMDSFDVVLNDGTEIDFFINGEWKDVDGKYKAIPTGFLPPAAVANARATQPNAQIFQVDREPYGFKFKFNNQMEVYTDMNGNIMGQKFDD
ncbi:PepSY-like domain-containing protein [Campylobacter cuniculorum]|uniref:PepSY-like domain-containing protein n=2 Tax=Campylobacter cuniculorum TaxID=374106 RepID=A0ABX6TZM3_9BACT|nr:PepSY-like domain-containing protein [Campylobacter cuniculorum]ARJ55954.1 hypothetical periplasmic protein (DUF2874 domains) [Campylobacter cuniculorum DSM 23162 = LMG 24588]QOR05174.1 PepSY-like domain-containing protein [Campylobacter cuniculorum]